MACSLERTRKQEKEGEGGSSHVEASLCMFVGPRP